MKNIVILTGAGLSAESGIKTYRDKDGLWSNYDPEIVSGVENWKKNPDKVIEFHDILKTQFLEGNFKPNTAHYALTKLQKEWNQGSVTIITQNIDGLHTDAGSEVIETHGTMRYKYCVSCNHFTEYNQTISLEYVCPNCSDVSTTRPLVVLFGEYPLRINEIDAALSDCQIYASIGTSGEVVPASLFVEQAKASGAKTFFLNKDSTYKNRYDESFIGNATEIVPKFVDDLLNNR